MLLSNIPPHIANREEIKHIVPDSALRPTCGSTQWLVHERHYSVCAHVCVSHCVCLTSSVNEMRGEGPVNKEGQRDRRQHPRFAARLNKLHTYSNFPETAQSGIREGHAIISPLDTLAG